MEHRHTGKGIAGQTDIDKTYFMPKSYVTYHKPRTVSDEQREQARQRMAKLNSVNNQRGKTQERRFVFMAV